MGFIGPSLSFIIRFFRVNLFQSDLPPDAFFKRNKGFCPLDSFYALYLLIQHFAQVRGVVTYDLCKNAVAAGGVMQLNDFFHRLQLFNGIIVLGTFFEENTKKSGNVIP